MALQFQSEEETPLAVSIPRLARLTGISEATLYLRANRSELPGCRKIGKRWIVHVETFNNFLKSGMGEEVGAS
jgi:predicted DNA-binding transcriptional regulator AlpA